MNNNEKTIQVKIFASVCNLQLLMECSKSFLKITASNYIDVKFIHSKYFLLKKHNLQVITWETSMQILHVSNLHEEDV